MIIGCKVDYKIMKRLHYARNKFAPKVKTVKTSFDCK